MEISEDVLKAIHKSFKPEDVEEVIRGLGWKESELMQFAILINSKGNIERFRKELEPDDWRDTMSAAYGMWGNWQKAVVKKGLADENWLQRSLEEERRQEEERKEQERRQEKGRKEWERKKREHVKTDEERKTERIARRNALIEALGGLIYLVLRLFTFFVLFSIILLFINRFEKEDILGVNGELLLSCPATVGGILLVLFVVRGLGRPQKDVISNLTGNQEEEPHTSEWSWAESSRWLIKEYLPHALIGAVTLIVIALSVGGAQALGSLIGVLCIAVPILVLFFAVIGLGRLMGAKKSKPSQN